MAIESTASQFSWSPMMMKTEEYIELINQLNADLFERVGESSHSFSYRTNGYIDMIYFDELPIWDSENDDRPFDDSDHQMELEKYIPMEFSRIVEEWSSLRPPIPLSKDEVESIIEQYSRKLFHPYSIRAGKKGNDFEVVQDGWDSIFYAEDESALNKFCDGFANGVEAERARESEL